MTENYGTFKKINVNLFFKNLSENQTLNIKEMLNDQMFKKKNFLQILTIQCCKELGPRTVKLALFHDKIVKHEIV